MQEVFELLFLMLVQSLSNFLLSLHRAWDERPNCVVRTHDCSASGILGCNMGLLPASDP